MDKLKMHSPDITQQNIEKLLELFPNCKTEKQDDEGGLSTGIDFDLLKQELSKNIVEGPQERYQLNWPGKKEALLTANAPIAKTLRPCREESVDFDTTDNLFIEGDNLDALKLLQETYLGKVKMIYIDPPYNTGKDFIYADNFAGSTDEYLQESGQKDDEGNRLVANTDSNGRFHSDWLSMMYSRVRQAKNLLTEDGAIFVSCDEVEQSRLRLLMDEIFGQGNFVADMVWAAGRKNDSRLVSVSHEYIVCYAKNTEYLKEKKIIWRQRKKGLGDIYKEYSRLKKRYKYDFLEITKGMKEWYRSLPDGHPSKAHKHYCNVDSRGVYFASDISWPGGGGPKYEVIHPSTLKPVKIPSRGWTTPDPRKMAAWIDDNKVHFGEDELTVPCLKKYLADSEVQTPYSVFYQDGRSASKRLRGLLGGDMFPFPKDETVIYELMEMLTANSDIVMDFFAGSATTAHAMIKLNAKDKGNRKFIMVQLPEACDDKSTAFKAGYSTIAEISKERIRRAGKKIKEEDPSAAELDMGFRVLKIDSSNMYDVHYTPDALSKADLFNQVQHIKSDRSSEDLLFQVMLDWGVDLSLPIRKETIEGKEVYFVNEDDLVACFDKGIDEALIKALATKKPLRVVFRDDGFVSDSVKINVEQIFKQLAPATDIKAI